jgi:V-type H+-transporting ATPase subunit a
VSNTASYLRLWALSLAHAELSKVFFEKTLLAPISNGDYVSGIIEVRFKFIKIDFLWILCLCEYYILCFTLYGFHGMFFAYSSFTLVNINLIFSYRVEFQNKFFKADGFKFQPYSFKCIIQSNE